ncbi:MAG: hypothetical protein EBU33_02670, partial [Sphingobacteriia bacterium]|nr:hypothetical protein [Sphingobacteriia bacterium]
MKKLFLLIVILACSSVSAQVDSTQSMNATDTLSDPSVNSAVSGQGILSTEQNPAEPVLLSDTLKSVSPLDEKKYLAIRFS